MKSVWLHLSTIVVSSSSMVKSTAPLVASVPATTGARYWMPCARRMISWIEQVSPSLAATGTDT
jgi:hypothetical protein